MGPELLANSVSNFTATKGSIWRLSIFNDVSVVIEDAIDVGVILLCQDEFKMEFYNY